MKNIIFSTKLALARRHALEKHRLVHLNEKKSLAQLLEEQDAQKRKLVAYAFQTLPFYQQQQVAAAL